MIAGLLRLRILFGTGTVRGDSDISATENGNHEEGRPVNHHPSIDPVSDAVLLHDLAREVNRLRPRIVLEREWAIEEAWLKGSSHRKIAQALGERPVWVREQLYMSGHDPAIRWPY
ncbi:MULTISPECIES: hypothetical protein [Brachybacterium]|uniref:Uncharacterized protein n=1 Tax=Brachybacterium fresconis TaxID=173363 RepID=A0ABS4YFP3_9MICO|nr:MULTISPECIES: hypothetical protein [Brachybacterium]MBP2407330.1 hypothetical protein [Brachybacterium fresconis]MDN5687861.1 hypothetical protein [Brachybacterium sp.]